MRYQVELAFPVIQICYSTSLTNSSWGTWRLRPSGLILCSFVSYTFFLHWRSANESPSKIEFSFFPALNAAAVLLEFSDFSDSVAGSLFSVHGSFLDFELGDDESLVESEGKAEDVVVGGLGHGFYKKFKNYILPLFIRLFLLIKIPLKIMCFLCLGQT